MSITSEHVTEYFREKTIHFAEQKRENPSLESLFISKSELFVELGAENVEDEETIIQCASSFIDMFNSKSENEELIIQTDIDEEEMERAKVFRKEYLEPVLQGKEKSGCFIATAAFGSPFAAEISILRFWRDTFLLKYSLGEFGVNVYNTLSPPIARVVAGNETLGKLVRILTKRFVLLLEKYYLKK
jgi:hypothetical protein